MRVGHGAIIRTIGDGPTLRSDGGIHRRIVVAMYQGKVRKLVPGLEQLIAADEKNRARIRGQIIN